MSPGVRNDLQQSDLKNTDFKSVISQFTQRPYLLHHYAAISVMQELFRTTIKPDINCIMNLDS